MVMSIEKYAGEMIRTSAQTSFTTYISVSIPDNTTCALIVDLVAAGYASPGVETGGHWRRSIFD